LRKVVKNHCNTSRKTTGFLQKQMNLMKMKNQLHYLWEMNPIRICLTH